MNKKRKAFTLTELLVVIAIIGILVGLSVPALMGAKKAAKKMAEKNTITNMELAIEQFKHDNGFYPESGLRTLPDSPTIATAQDGLVGNDPPDQGAHRLFESLEGLDTLGFQAEHYYDTAINKPPFANGTPIAPNRITGVIEETKRWGPYIGLDKIRYGSMQEAHAGSTLFTPGNTNINPVFLDQLDYNEPRAILYYRARKSGRMIWDPGNLSNSIYNYFDNEAITLDKDTNGAYIHHVEGSEGVASFHPDVFYDYIVDPRTLTGAIGSERPYNRDSFLLIGAGWDHMYGTEDDITNFNR